MAHAPHNRTWKGEAGGSKVKNHPWPHRKSEASMVYLRHYFESKTKDSNSIKLLDLTNMNKISHPTVCDVSQFPRYKVSVNKNQNQNKKPTKLQLDKISLLVTVEQNESLEDKLENSSSTETVTMHL